MHQLHNLTSNTIILNELQIAENFLERFKGLMGKKPTANQGLWIKPCNSIHCFFMKVSIDVLFLDKDNQVIHKVEAMKPWTISPLIRKAKSVIEGNSGSFKTVNLGDQLTIV